MSDQPPQGPTDQGPQFQLVIPPDQMAGVWANFAQVSESPYEFTLDFIRLDFSGSNQALVVARVSMSPLFVSQLVDALQMAWQRYAERSFPEEVHGSGAEGEGQEG